MLAVEAVGRFLRAMGYFSERPAASRKREPGARDARPWNFERLVRNRVAAATTPGMAPANAPRGQPGSEQGPMALQRFERVL